jgi:hypothetical protein
MSRDRSAGVKSDPCLASISVTMRVKYTQSLQHHTENGNTYSINAANVGTIFGDSLTSLRKYSRRCQFSKIGLQTNML